MIEICSFKKKNHVKALKEAWVSVNRQSYNSVLATLGPHLWNNLVNLINSCFVIKLFGLFQIQSSESEFCLNEWVIRKKFCFSMTTDYWIGLLLCWRCWSEYMFPVCVWTEYMWKKVHIISIAPTEIHRSDTWTEFALSQNIIPFKKAMQLHIHLIKR